MDAAGRRHGHGAVGRRARAGTRRHEAHEVLVVAALAVLALVAALLVPTYPNYDTYFHLVWGRELMHGMKPDFEAYAAPTEHPLFLAICALVGLVGTDGERLIVLICVLSLVALAWGSFRVGEACFGLWPGAGRRRLRRLELRLPALRRAGLRRRPLPRARAVGGGPRGPRAAPRRAGHGRARGGRAAAPGGLGPGRRLLAVVRVAADRPARARRRRPASCGPWSICGSPAIRSSRCTPPATSPTSSTATAGCRRSRARSSPSSPTPPARRLRSPAPPGRCCCGGCARAARCTSRSRSSAPAS